MTLGEDLAKMNFDEIQTTLNEMTVGFLNAVPQLNKMCMNAGFNDDKSCPVATAAPP